MAALVVAACITFIAPLFGGATFVGRDHLTHTLPAKQVIADSLASGHVPEWWQAVDLGVSFAANPNHSALYPPVWLLAVLPMPWGADALLVLHLLVAGLGVAALARRLGADAAGCAVAGVAFMLSGFVVSTVVHGGPALTLAWLPWIAWAADRVASSTNYENKLQRTAILAGLVAAQLLAGDPSFAIAGGLLALGVASCRAQKRLPTLSLVAGAYLAAVALAALVIVPALYLWTDSARAEGITDGAATAWSMHPLRMLELIWPDALGDPNQASEHLARVIADSSAPLKLAPSWALSVYLSIPVIGAAVVGYLSAERKARTLAFVALAFGALALGRYTPIYDAFRFVFVPERVVRYPEKYLVGVLVFACAFAGVGWSAINTRTLPKRTLVIALAVVGILVAFIALGLAVIPGLARTSDITSLVPALDVEAGLQKARSAALAAIGVTVVVLAALYLARKRRWLAHVAAVAIIGHLIGRAWNVLPTFDRDVLAHRPQILSDTQPGRLSRPQQHRVRPNDTLAGQARTLYEGAAANTATRYGFSYLVGYDQGHSGRFDGALGAVGSGGDPIHDRFGVEYEIVERDDVGGRAVLGSDEPYGPYALVRNQGARPHAFVTARWQWTDASGVPTTGSLDVVRLAGVGDSHQGREGVTPCSVTSQRPERVHVTCDAPEAGYAVLLDAWAPGWTATLDGATTSIELADGLVRAVRVPAGKHSIAYRYATPGLRLGALISVGAWFAWIAVLAIPFLRRSRNGTT